MEGGRTLLRRWKPRSLQARQLLAASLCLVAFLALAGYSLGQVFAETARSNLRQQLKSYALAYAKNIDFARDGSLYTPDLEPDPRFGIPGSGLYAQVVLPSGHWASLSAEGPLLPQAKMLEPRQESFGGPYPVTQIDGSKGEVYRYGVGYIWADGGHAAVLHHAQLARVQADLGVAGVTADQLGVGAGRTGDLPALHRLQLDVVDDRADRHAAQRHGVTRLHVRLFRGHDLVAGLQALRGQDVGQLAVFVLHQGDEGRTVRVVLQALDRGGHVELAALEVDHAVQALRAAAAEADGDAAVAAAAARLRQAFHERLFRPALVELGLVHQHQLAATRRGRIELLQSHRIRAQW